MGIVLVIVLFLGYLFWAHPNLQFDVIEIDFPAGFEFSGSLCLNNHGMVSGTMNPRGQTEKHVFVWDPTNRITDLGNWGITEENFSIVDLNDQGQMAGIYFTKEIPTEDPNNPNQKPRNRAHSFFYDPARGFRSIEAPEGLKNPWVFAMNNRSEAVGYCYDLVEKKAKFNAFQWDPETGSHDLNISGMAFDINDSGSIVGNLYNLYKGFVWDARTGLQEFPNPSTDNFLYPQINNENRISVYCRGLQDSTRLYLGSLEKGFKNMGDFGDQNEWFTRCNDRGEFCVRVHNELKLFGESLREYEESLLVIPGRRPFPLQKVFKKDSLDFRPAHINNNGWIVGVADDKGVQRVFVLIPKNYPKLKNTDDRMIKP